MRPLATDTHDFPSIRRDGKIYVDKTNFIHRLVSDANSNLFFISRPRRFGKSLTVSALKALFQGRRELFKGLAIDALEWSWEEYPVIHFEFNDLTTTSTEEFAESLAYHVRNRLEKAGYTYDKTIPPPENFGNAIDALSAANDGKGAVILVDEYDAPVGHCLDDIPKAEAVRARLSAVYSQMKNRTGNIKFLFMTGVSKFTKLSVFSALSNIRDVSQFDEYATMFGYTEEELTANFEEHLREHASIMGKSYEDYREELKRWYNGFRFAKNDPTTVYNPISVAYTLDQKDPSGFSATWATTGRPSMLMNYLRREDFLAVNPEKVEDVAAAEFDVADLHNLTSVAMLFQSGYLTIKDYDPDDETYTLAKWETVFVGLKALYAHLPYGPQEETVQEFSYERVLYTLLASQGMEVVAEDRQSNGRADIVAKHKKGVFIFELKVDEPVDRAFAQIREKNYAAPYLADSRPIWLIGLSFDSKTRHLIDCAAVCQKGQVPV